MVVRDGAGASDDGEFRYVVVYDPSAGFLTGGGWIVSPAGAYASDPTLMGEATFGFVAKYQKGASVPKGETQFQFHAGGLNFQSTAYEWLVVAGSKAEFKGSGTVNGAGTYDFQLTANDGSLDSFRIKIWDRVSGAVVYDNKRGSADDGDDATALGGGSIVLHKG